MKNLIAVCILLVGCSLAYAKTESGSLDAQSVVAYGQGVSGIVPIKVDVDGSVYVSGLTTSDGDLTIDGTLYAEKIVTSGTDETIYGSSYPTNIIDFNYNATKVQVSPNLIVDNSIYLAATDGGATGGAGLYISQPDGGCSKCYVDAAGTTFACANIACPSGM